MMYAAKAIGAIGVSALILLFLCFTMQNIFMRISWTDAAQPTQNIYTGKRNNPRIKPIAVNMIRSPPPIIPVRHKTSIGIKITIAP